MPDPTFADVCICGHRESRHRRALDGCRGGGCKCPRFLNEHVIDQLRSWLHAQLSDLPVLEARIRKARHG